MTGAILIGILAITVVSILLGVSQFSGVIAPPPSIAPTFLQLDVFGALGTGILQVILVFVLVEVFDATGTLIGVAKRAGLLTEGPGHSNPQLGKALLADSVRSSRARSSARPRPRPMSRARPACRPAGGPG